MGFPKIPDPEEIANMTAEAMLPMMEMINELVEVQRAMAAQQGIVLPPRKVALPAKKGKAA